jgi:hypothetical protein
MRVEQDRHTGRVEGVLNLRAPVRARLNAPVIPPVEQALLPQHARLGRRAVFLRFVFVAVAGEDGWCWHRRLWHLPRRMRAENEVKDGGGDASIIAESARFLKWDLTGFQNLSGLRVCGTGFLLVVASCAAIVL